jgi:thiamine biosynthesis lipoprotein
VSVSKRGAGALGLALVLAATAGVAWRQRAASPPVLRAERWLMGTQWVIRIAVGGQDPEALRAAAQAAFDEVARVEAVMSEWQKESAISAVNRSAGGPPVEVPQELSDIVRRANTISALSEGAFDVTWKGMGKLWDFSADDFLPPDDAAIKAARSRVDYTSIVFDGHKLGLPQTGMALGLGGIAKGYGVDRAGVILREHGVKNFLVDGGGDVLLEGFRDGLPEGRPWRVGVRHPRGNPTDILTVVETAHGAVVTSGDYERFREVEGVRYHHIIDPRTGRPARGCQAVTVVAESAESADALATAIFVLGPEAGLKLAASQPGVEALIIDSSGKLHRTPGFPQAEGGP